MLVYHKSFDRLIKTQRLSDLIMVDVLFVLCATEKMQNYYSIRQTLKGRLP